MIREFIFYCCSKEKSRGQLIALSVAEGIVIGAFAALFASVK